MNTIGREELKGMLDKHDDFKLINVLSGEAFQKAHIPGSCNIPVENADFAHRVEEQTGGKDDTIVVYCASVDCNASRIAAEKLEQAGFTHVYAYEGGVRGWKEGGYALHTET